MKRLETVPLASLLVVLIALLGSVVVLLSALGLVEDSALRLNLRQFIEALSIAVAGLAVGRGLAARNRRS